MLKELKKWFSKAWKKRLNDPCFRVQTKLQEPFMTCRWQNTKLWNRHISMWKTPFISIQSMRHLCLQMQFPTVSTKTRHLPHAACISSRKISWQDRGNQYPRIKCWKFYTFQQYCVVLRFTQHLMPYIVIYHWDKSRQYHQIVCRYLDRFLHHSFKYQE